MITLSTIPQIHLARDPFPVTFSSNNYLENAGDIASIELKLIKLPAVGNNFTIVIEGITQTFSFVTTPDDSSLQIQAGTTETFYNYICYILIPALKLNWTIVSLFNINIIGSDVISFTAKNAGYVDLEIFENTEISVGSGDDPSVSMTPVFDSNIVFYTGTDPIYHENFRINYQLLNSNKEFITGAFSHEPDSSGEVSIDLKNIIKGWAKSTIDFSDESLIKLSDDVFIIVIRFWESHGIGDDAVNRQINDSSYIYLIDGSSSWIDQAKNNDLNRWWGDTISKSLWLSQKPNNHYILPDQKVLLKFMPDLEYSSININIQPYVGDTSESLIQIFKNMPGKFTPYQLNVSPLKLAFSDQITKYDVYLTSGSQTVSSVLTFYIDRNYYLSKRFFIYRNALGGYDSIQLLGKGSVAGSYSRIKVSSPVFKHKTTDRETRISSVSEELTFTVNLGFLNRIGDGKQQWANYIRQLYMTDEAYEIIQNQAFPIFLSKEKQPLLDDDNFIPSFFELEYKRAFFDVGATSDIPTLSSAYNESYNESYN